jgi:hypothetical protein
MKKIYFLLINLFLCIGALAQQDYNDNIATSRNRITEKAMITLKIPTTLPQNDYLHQNKLRK